jgi:hypothetical protein
MVTKSICRLIVVAVMLWCGALPGRVAVGQTADFLCSGGPRDGLNCAADDDCFVSCPSSFGACVLVNGVCNGGEFDGFPCDCPGGVCLGSGTEGTCQGGAFAGDPCRTAIGAGNCNSGIACVGTQKICLSGDLQSFGCLGNDDCDGATCGSSGKFCDGGDFDFYSCVANVDCSGGNCIAPDFCSGPTPTPTFTRTRTQTRTPTGGTPPPTVLTATPTRTQSGVPVPPTPTSTAPSPTRRATATVTPTIPFSGVVAQPASRGSSFLDLVDASQLPVSGHVVRIGNDPACVAYNRLAANTIPVNTLALESPLAEDVPSGTVVQVGSCIRTQRYVQESCAIVARQGTGGWLLVLGLLGLTLRRHRTRSR